MRMARAEGAQANNKRAARQCEKRRWFAPRKVSVFFVDYGPKGAGGQAKSHLAFLPEYLYPVGFFADYGPKVSKGRAESPLVRPQAHTPPPAGPDAPTPARIGTCRPMGRSHFSFGGERKVCKRKPAARRLREKALYCPFWRRGSLCRAQWSWPAHAYNRARSELAFFRRQNGRAFFPPLPIAALLPRSWRRADLPLAG